jgi:enamine deaminase RidA (YjgF/YER057c/UK114 family)
MNKCTPLILVILSYSLLLTSCKKNSVEEEYVQTVQPTVPDLSTQINASVSGFITNETGSPVEGAIVKKGTSMTATDAYGYFRLEGIDFAKSAGFVQVTKEGYFTGTRTFLPTAGKETFIRLQLVPKIIAGTVSSSTGGAVTTADGASVTLPANAVVVVSSNAPYTGNVNIAIHWYNPADMDVTQLTMPGDLRGIDSDGFLNVLTTYGMLNVELIGDGGELLQMASGMNASLNFPIPASLQSIAPSSIPLWYFNETNGLWKEDGTANKNGSSYQGDVSHFTPWNCDQPMPSVDFRIQIINDSLQPMASVAVSFTVNGQTNATAVIYTNQDGIAHTTLPGNTALKLKLSSACNSSLYTKNINTVTTAIDLGSVKVDALQYGGGFKGTVNKCGGLPVTNGYVIISSAAYSQAVEIVNGYFNSGAVPVCPNSNASVIAFDRETAIQSAVQNVTVLTGTNDLGIIEACGAPTSESITFSVDGVPGSLLTPFHLFVGNFDFANNMTNINGFDQVNSTTSFDLNFSGIDGTTGVHTITGGNVIINGITYHGSFPNLSITNYGLIGEFISGSFSANVTDDGGNPHTIDNCTFNVYRTN